jgi:catalase
MKPLIHANEASVVDNANALTAGSRGPALLQDIWLLEKLAHVDREVIPERRVHARGSGSSGHSTVTQDVTQYTKAKLLGAVGKATEVFARFSRRSPAHRPLKPTVFQPTQELS